MNARFTLTCILSFGLALHAQDANSGSYADYVSGQYPAYDPAINDQGYGQYQYNTVDYDLSGSGGGSSFSNSSIYFPEQSYFEYLGPMKPRHGQGSGRATMTNWHTKLALANVTSDSWRFNVDTAFRLSWFDGKGDGDMDVHRLYTIWLNFGAHYNLWGKSYISFGVNPEFSSDFDSWVARNFSMGGYLLYSSRLSDNFMFSGGVAIAPQLGEFPLFPFFGFTWKASQDWRIEMKGIRLAAVNKVTDYFEWGPFVTLVSGSWVVKHNHAHARYDWTSGVAGIASEVGLGRWGKVHPVLIADAGFTFANTARFKTTNGRHELMEKKYDPGFYMRAGLRFEF